MRAAGTKARAFSGISTPVIRAIGEKPAEITKAYLNGRGGGRRSIMRSPVLETRVERRRCKSRISHPGGKRRHLGTPSPIGPLSVENQNRNCAVDPPRSATSSTISRFSVENLYQGWQRHLVRSTFEKKWETIYRSTSACGMLDKERGSRLGTSRKPSGGRSPTGWLRQSIQNQPLSTRFRDFLSEIRNRGCRSSPRNKALPPRWERHLKK